MKHELKIIFDFDSDDGYVIGNTTRIYLDNEQLGLIQQISFEANANFEPPKIIINYGINCIKEFDSQHNSTKKAMFDTACKLAKTNLIKSNLIDVLKKYINLKAFW